MTDWLTAPRFRVGFLCFIVIVALFTGYMAVYGMLQKAYGTAAINGFLSFLNIINFRSMLKSHRALKEFDE